MGAYLELEMGEEGGMRVGTLGLVVRGLWEGMVGGRRWVEVAFEVWYVWSFAFSRAFCLFVCFFAFGGDGEG